VGTHIRIGVNAAQSDVKLYNRIKKEAIFLNSGWLVSSVSNYFIVGGQCCGRGNVPAGTAMKKKCSGVSFENILMM